VREAGREALDVPDALPGGVEDGEGEEVHGRQARCGIGARREGGDDAGERVRQGVGDGVLLEGGQRERA
jgi:hypothetical protein